MVSVNQVKNLYAVKAVAEVVTSLPAEPSEGDVVYYTTDHEFYKYDGTNWGKADKGTVAILDTLHGVKVLYVGEGGVIGSDYIKKDQVISAIQKDAEDFDVPMKKAVITLNSNVNSGAPVTGEDYVVDIIVSNYVIMADESVLVKFGAVRTTTGMTADAFYKALVKSFVRNFSRDINKFFKFSLQTAGSPVEVKSAGQDLTGVTATGIIVEELPQTADYVRGEFEVKTVNFQVVPHKVVSNGDEVDGLTVTTGTTSEVLHNGYAIADTEYFCMGERGDQYRMTNYPRVIRTKYMVDETKAYDTLDLAFYFVGRGISQQHSDKAILFVVENASTGTSTVMSALKSDLETALGITIA